MQPSPHLKQDASLPRDCSEHEVPFHGRREIFSAVLCNHAFDFRHTANTEPLSSSERSVVLYPCHQALDSQGISRCMRCVNVTTSHREVVPRVSSPVFRSRRVSHSLSSKRSRSRSPARSLGLLFPGPAVAADPIYGRSSKSVPLLERAVRQVPSLRPSTTHVLVAVNLARMFFYLSLCVGGFEAGRQIRVSGSRLQSP